MKNHIQVCGLFGNSGDTGLPKCSYDLLKTQHSLAITQKLKHKHQGVDVVLLNKSDSWPKGNRKPSTGIQSVTCRTGSHIHLH